MAIDIKTEKLIDIKDAAELLGVSYSSAYAWIKSGKIESVEFGGRTIRTSVEAIERHIAEQNGGDKPAKSNGGGISNAAIKKMLEAM